MPTTMRVSSMIIIKIHLIETVLIIMARHFAQPSTMEEITTMRSGTGRKWFMEMAMEQHSVHCQVRLMLLPMN